MLSAKGYRLKRVALDFKMYAKTYNGYDVEIVMRGDELISKRVVVNSIKSQEELDKVQIALNNLERDLK